MNAERTPIFRWDIFCQVIDNHGDLGVCWRLAVNLAQRGQQVRLWIDLPEDLSWLAPAGADGVETRRWTRPIDMTDVAPGDVLVEAFGCEIPPEFSLAYVQTNRSNWHACRWINLEYLSAESYVERCHTLPSPIMSGPGKGLCKHFFYPGFTQHTGGLLREADLLARQRNFDRRHWLEQQGIPWQGERLISLFCYEPAALDELLDTLATDRHPTLLLITAGRATAAVQQALKHRAISQPNWNSRAQLSWVYLPMLSQIEFDHLLWACDVNFVRGEDSLVRALWAGKAMVWQIYPQDDGAHHAKLHAFMDWLQAPDSLRQFHDRWNAIPTGPSENGQPKLPAMVLDSWQNAVLAARERLLQQCDLATAMIQFVAKTD